MIAQYTMRMLRSGALRPRLFHPHARSVSTAVQNFKLEGFCCPPVTPMRTDGSINLDWTDKYVDHFVAFKCPNAYVLGTTGEAANLSVAERKAVAEAWISSGKGRLSKIIVQVGAGNLPDTQELAAHAQSSGADGIACIGPTFFKPDSQDTLMDYMAEVSAAAPDLPFMLYDFEGLTGIQCDVNAFFEAAKTRLPNLVGMKYTTTDMTALSIFHAKWPNTNLLMGSDELYIHGLALGIRGNTIQSYAGNVLTRLQIAYDAGDSEALNTEQNRVFQLCNIRRKYGLSIPGATKVMLQAMGLDVGSPRLPLAPIPPATARAVREDMKGIGFFDWAY